MKLGVLALQGAWARHAEAVAALGAQPVEVRRPEDLAGIEAVILPGGESTTMSQLLATSGLHDVLAERLADGLPAFGTCAGMILLAKEILDGRPDQRCFGVVDVAVRRNAFGRQVDSFEAPLAVSGMAGGDFPATFIRAPVVERVGDGVEVLATIPGPERATGRGGGSHGETQPVLCRQGPVLVAAFHPELSDDLRLHQAFLASL
ncbi:MAG: pyridoxal 5'-phosphate synthase glutaminase subunit PdxT [Actinomycetota bacterium]|nr:pyridoxal 5'-phosphate synthase glutaminase subunit PdxT [Actinomycetota bacterium]